jgi:hypothetical protein
MLGDRQGRAHPARIRSEHHRFLTGFGYIFFVAIVLFRFYVM